MTTLFRHMFQAAALESEPELERQEKFIDGINAQTLKLLHLFLFGRSHANFIEVLGCSGGCQNGPCSFSGPNGPFRSSIC